MNFIEFSNFVIKKIQKITSILLLHLKFLSFQNSV